MWLGGKSLGTFIETDGVGVDELKNFCANDTLIGYATADNIEDLEGKVNKKYQTKTIYVENLCQTMKLVGHIPVPINLFYFIRITIGTLNAL